LSGERLSRTHRVKTSISKEVSAMLAKPALLVVLLLSLLGGFATPVSRAEPVMAVTVDFDALGPWTDFFRMDPLFFKSDGIRFSGDYMVGMSNGQAVLIGNQAWNTPQFTIAASFTRPVSSVTASIRMGLQGTSDYTLVAYSASGDVIGSSTITLSQNGLDGNFYDIVVRDLPSKAKSFSIVGGIEYGVQSITYEH
jgi:hypothetical protein